MSSNRNLLLLNKISIELKEKQIVSSFPFQFVYSDRERDNFRTIKSNVCSSNDFPNKKILEKS